MPLSAATRSESPRSPQPWSGLAPPTPSSLTITSRRPSMRSTRTVAWRRARTWTRWSAPRTPRSRRPSRPPQAAGRRASDDVHRHRRAGGEGTHGRLQPAIGEHRRMDAAREVAQLVEAEPELVDAGVEQRGRLGVRGARMRARRRLSARATSRDWAPSWRSRSRRRRSALAAWTMRAREASSSTSRARNSASSRWLSRARRRGAGGAHRSRSCARSWTITATERPVADLRRRPAGRPRRQLDRRASAST